MNKVTKRFLSALAAGVMFASGGAAVTSAVAEDYVENDNYYESDEIAYTFQNDDTLRKVSKKFYGTVEYWKPLQIYNHIENTRAIPNGKVIFVPRDVNDLLTYARNHGYTGSAQTPAEQHQEAVSHAGDGVYIFQEGDTLIRISKKLYGTEEYWKILRDYNNITDTRNIQNGTKIYLPSNLTRIVSTPTQTETGVIPAHVSISENDGEFYYTFQPGDTLIRVSKKLFGTEDYWKVLRDYNNITDTRNIQNGTKIYIPGDLHTRIKTGTTSSSKTPSTGASHSYVEGDTIVYIFQPGDTLIKVSKKFYGTGEYWKEIRNYNNITDTRNIQNGTKIYLPSELNYLINNNVNGATVVSEPEVTTTRRSDVISHVFGNKDTLYGLAKKYYGDGRLWTHLATINGIDNPRAVPTGKVLLIPTTKELLIALASDAVVVEPEVEEPVVEMPVEEGHEHDGRYVVQRGDTLSKICYEAYGTSNKFFVKKLAEYNGIKDINKIRTGQVIYLPDYDVLLADCVGFGMPEDVRVKRLVI